MPHVQHRSSTGSTAVGHGGLRPTAQGMYEQALRDAGRTPLSLRAATWSRALPVDRWCADADAADAAVLEPFAAALPDRAELLDLGCGPGRHTAWLRDAGLRALGVDSSPVAIALAHGRGAPALLADALGPLPAGHHGWDGVLLLDGNIGIGGDPLLLLCRVRDLLRPRGRVLVELDPDGGSGAGPAVLDDGRARSATFPLGPARRAAAGAEACAAGLTLVQAWHDGTSACAVLVPR